MKQSLDILVPEFSEIDDSEFSRAEEKAIAYYSSLLQTYPGAPAEGSASTRNIGKGADWIVVVISLGSLFFVIPKAHKHLRESLEEWQRIYKEFKSLISWLLGNKPALYPDQYLFLVALFVAAETANSNDLVFLGFTRLPEDQPDLFDHGSLLFSFGSAALVIQVAVGRNGHVLWQNELELTSLGPNNPRMVIR